MIESSKIHFILWKIIAVPFSVDLKLYFIFGKKFIRRGLRIMLKEKTEKQENVALKMATLISGYHLSASKQDYKRIEFFFTGIVECAVLIQDRDQQLRVYHVVSLFCVCYFCAFSNCLFGRTHNRIRHI